MKAPVLILGGTSRIGRMVATELGRHGYPLIVVARNGPELDRVCNDVRLRTQMPVDTLLLDVDDIVTGGRLPEFLSGRTLSGVFVFWGYMGSGAHDDPAEIAEVVGVNLIAPVVAVEQSLPHIAAGGFIGLVSSVAGDRGRASNYLYGASKSAVNTFGQGLDHRMARERRGVSVTILKVGMVDTRMTWGAKNSRLVADPAGVAKKMVAAVLSRKRVAYVPGSWRLIMRVVRSIPPAVFAKMDF